MIIKCLNNLILKQNNLQKDIRRRKILKRNKNPKIKKNKIFLYTPWQFKKKQVHFHYTELHAWESMATVGIQKSSENKGVEYV
ncbi:hypothetical protein PL75_00810 [Neisseria arctica]|uniref:Uncharacterized protein n=1 Tax=Neisseria arctica TaxID=1470200 RepID=A0A0J1C6E5_9NEIS|nr:hypothetical protein PL75_00810 [Neisseria arctica]